MGDRHVQISDVFQPEYGAKAQAGDVARAESVVAAEDTSGGLLNDLDLRPGKGSGAEFAGDPQGSYLTDAFLVPLSARSTTMPIRNSHRPNLAGHRRRRGAGDSAGHPNLAAYQNGNGPLATLTDQPLRIDWKPAGDDPSYYRLVRNYGVLPDCNRAREWPDGSSAVR